MSSIPQHVKKSVDPPKAIAPFDACQPPTIRLYPLSNYTFATKEPQPEEDDSVKGRLQRLENYYEKYGMRRFCEGVMICHEHNHPHVLTLQIANAFFKLPGDYIPPDANELTGFKQRLTDRLSPPPGTSLSTPNDNEWNVFDTLAQWYRPNFETFMYPYLPPHVTRPKECKKLYFIQLPKERVLSVPKNMKLLAVPLFELYDNTARYGPQLSALPHYLSRYRWEFVDEQGNVTSWTPGGQRDAKLTTRVLAGGQNEEHIDVDQRNGDAATNGGPHEDTQTTHTTINTPSAGVANGHAKDQTMQDG